MSSTNSITIGDRLEHGVVTVAEILTLASRSRTRFYQDVKGGLVSIRKVGRKTVIPGPIAKAYIRGEAPAEKGAEHDHRP